MSACCCGCLLALSLSAQTTPPRPAEEDVVLLSPFAVQTNKDVGYEASESLAGTGLWLSDGPTSELPVGSPTEVAYAWRLSWREPRAYLAVAVALGLSPGVIVRTLNKRGRGI